MRRFLSLLLLAASAMVAAQLPSQPLIGLHVRYPSETYRGQVMEKLKAGWEFGVIQAKTPNWPDATDYSGFERDVEDSLRTTGRVLIRHSSMVPKSGYWLDKAGGQEFESEYYPPLGPKNALAIARAAVMQRYRDIAERVRVRLNLPASSVWHELRNESGIGGVNGPIIRSWGGQGGSRLYEEFKEVWTRYAETGDPAWWAEAKYRWCLVFASWTWNAGPMPEGTIPARFAKFNRAVRGRVVFGSHVVVGYTFEGQKTYVGWNELNSANPNDEDWVRYFEMCPVVAYNCYVPPIVNVPIETYVNGRRITPWPKKTLTPYEAGRYTVERLRQSYDMLRSHPLFADKQIGVTEFNLDFSRAPSLALLAPYRSEIYRQVNNAVFLRHIGVFTSTSLDPTSHGNELWYPQDGRLLPLGGEVDLTGVFGRSVAPYDGLGKTTVVGTGADGSPIGGTR